MKIGFDAKRYFLNATGLGNYSRNTVRLLNRYVPEHEYFLYTPRVSSRFAPPVSTPALHTRTPKNVLSRIVHPVWRSWLVSREIARDRLDIFHGLSHEIPYGISRKTKTVVTVHDLIFMRHPELYHRIDVAMYTGKYRSSCRRADRIIAISEQTKKDLITFFSIDPKKIDVVYQSCDPAFYLPLSAEKRQTICSKYHLPGRFILYVGSLAERKNVLTLLNALGRMHPDRRLPLVLVGRGNTAYLSRIHESIARNKLADEVIFLHTVPTRDLPAIYQQARLFVYPSRYEGFGIPILEALFSKTPVITSQGSCFREAGGPDTVYTPPGDVDTLTRSMEEVLNDPSMAGTMSEKGWEYAATFHERQVAINLMAVYTKLCEQY